MSDIKVVTSGDYTFYKISPSVHEKVPTNIYLVLDKDGKLVELSAGLDIFNHIFIALTFNGELDEVKAPANAVKIHFKELTMLLDMVGII